MITPREWQHDPALTCEEVACERQPVLLPGETPNEGPDLLLPLQPAAAGLIQTHFRLLPPVLQQPQHIPTMCWLLWGTGCSAAAGVATSGVGTAVQNGLQGCIKGLFGGKGPTGGIPHLQAVMWHKDV